MRKDCDDDQCEELHAYSDDDDDVDWGGDPINARKLAVGFVQSLGGISFLKLFRISFLPQERDAPGSSKCLYSSSEKESQDYGSPHH